MREQTEVQLVMVKSGLLPLTGSVGEEEVDSSSEVDRESMTSSSSVSSAESRAVGTVKRAVLATDRREVTSRLS